MKKSIHPVLHHVIFVDAATGDEIVTRSTMTSAETRQLNGVPHYVIKRDITAFSHPFYTGQSRVIDNEGRVERFRRRYVRANADKM